MRMLRPGFRGTARRQIHIRQRKLHLFHSAQNVPAETGQIQTRILRIADAFQTARIFKRFHVRKNIVLLQRLQLAEKRIAVKSALNKLRTARSGKNQTQLAAPEPAGKASIV